MDKGKIRDRWYAFRNAIDETNLHDLWVTKYDKGFVDALLVIQEGLKQEGMLDAKPTQTYEITLSIGGLAKATDVVIIVRAENQTDALVQIMEKHADSGYDMIKIHKLPNKD